MLRGSPCTSRPSGVAPYPPGPGREPTRRSAQWSPPSRLARAPLSPGP